MKQYVDEMKRQRRSTNISSQICREPKLVVVGEGEWVGEGVVVAQKVLKHFGFGIFLHQTKFLKLEKMVSVHKQPNKQPTILTDKQTANYTNRQTP